LRNKNNKEIKIMVLVTDVKNYRKRRVKKLNPETGKMEPTDVFEPTQGYYMQGYLADNLSHIPWYLDQSWDVVGIVSGHALVRVGKSTIAMQIAYYIAWMLAGGNMIFDYDKKGNPVKVGMEKPTRPVRFDLKENVVFSAEDLQDTAKKLYEKYGKGQVIVYDEGRQGLDSTRAMENINKGMQDFFQECGFMGHVILIVLPSFFKLHEDYAVARSLFLVDVFADSQLQRGYFNFYNAQAKELLYFFGKKKLGASAKYASARPSFWGRYTKWLPFDKIEYEKLKKEAIDKKMKERGSKNMRLQRDIMIWYIHKILNIPLSEVSDKLATVGGIEIGERGLMSAVEAINNLIIKQKGY
jgi:hypothetical protein